MQKSSYGVHANVMLSPSRILKIDHLVMLNSFLNSVFSSKKWLYYYFDIMSQYFKINRTPHYFDILIQMELKSFHFWVDWRLDNPLNCEVEKKVWCEDRCKNCIRRLFGVRGLKKRGRGASGGFNIKGWDACPMNPTRKVKQLCFTHHHNSLWGDNTQSQTNISLFYLPIILILKCDCRRLGYDTGESFCSSTT